MKRSWMIVVAGLLMVSSSWADDNKYAKKMPSSIYDPLPVKEKIRVKKYLKKLHEVSSNKIRSSCGVKVPVEIKYGSFGPDQKLKWYQAISFCAQTLDGAAWACDQGADYKEGFAKRVKKIVCAHDPKGFARYHHHDGPALAITKGALQVGYTSNAKGVTSNIVYGVKDWLLANL